MSGYLLILVGLGLLADVVRRAVSGGDPDGGWMIAISLIALAVNVYVLRLLQRQNKGEVHIRAAWIFTRADVVANTAVILSGVAVVLSGRITSYNVCYTKLLRQVALGRHRFRCDDLDLTGTNRLVVEERFTRGELDFAFFGQCNLHESRSDLTNVGPTR